MLMTLPESVFSDAPPAGEVLARRGPPADRAETQWAWICPIAATSASALSRPTTGGINMSLKVTRG